MSDETSWTDAERNEQVSIKSHLSSINTNKKWCIAGAVGGFILIGASPLLGLAVMTGSYFAFSYHQKQEAIYREKHRNLLLKKKLDPLNYGFDENGKYLN
jgi:hypothetical protein